MKTKRKFMSILLALCMVFTLMPMTAFAAGTDDNKLPVVYAGICAGSSDNNTGADADHAVLTLDKALELVEESGTIMVCGQLYTNGDFMLENVTLERANNYTEKLLYVNSGSLTLKNVTIDGKKDDIKVGDFGALIAVPNTTLNIGEEQRRHGGIWVWAEPHCEYDRRKNHRKRLRHTRRRYFDAARRRVESDWR